MELNLGKGKYVVAVSGGVDSVVLLDLLTRHNNEPLDLIVAHFDHGVRSDSGADRLFVESLAKNHNLPFSFATGNLGPDASEERARAARYKFLRAIVKDNKAAGLITAHHQDDLIETAIINIARGTGRRGLSSLRSSDGLIRPLLKYPKTEIVKYANANKLTWHEDSTNTDQKYLRNYIRLSVLPKFDNQSRLKLLSIIEKQTELNDQIDGLVETQLSQNLKDKGLPRLWLNSLDSELSREIIAGWLRVNNIRGYDRVTLERLSVSLKVSRPGSLIDVMTGYKIRASRDYLALEPIER